MKQAINASKMKEDNQRLILDCIRQQPISRVELSVMIHLTRPSITMIVESLLNDGLLIEEPTESKKVGRHPILLQIKSDARYIAAVNIKRHIIEVGIVNLGGKVLAEDVFQNINQNADDVLFKISITIEEMIKKCGIDKSLVLGIGVCAPGPLDYKKGVILNPPNFNTWHNVHVAERLNLLTGFNVKLENAANSMALEEKYFGKARNLSNFMIVLVDSGIGSGVVVRDNLYRGVSGRASEIGHTSVCFNGPLCACGNHGCLEKYAAIPEILKGTKYNSWQEFIDSFDSSDEGKQILEREAEYLSAATINAINLLDLESVILMGDVSYKGDKLCEMIGRLVTERAISKPESDSFKILWSDNPCYIRTAAMPIIYNFFKG